jgi:glutamate formiminotransferase/formiminotetrahydrofolate cyclodeaminase
MKEIIECVVNISEGRRQYIIDKISTAIQSAGNTILTHVDVGHDANRTVFTFFTDLLSLESSILSMFDASLSSIDMESHIGKHPRIGVVDVCPFIPIKGISKDELIPIVNGLAKQIGDQFNLPVYLYEDSSPTKQKLETIRRGEYESLESRLTEKNNLPDYGSFKKYRSYGATIMGVRSFLLAYNINLDTDDASKATYIAKRIRGSGYKSKGVQIPGEFSSVKAIGWYMKEYGFAQVSTNLTDYKSCCFHNVFESCKMLALEQGVTVTGSELIGLAPNEALLLSGKFYSNENDEDKLIQAAIKNLGLEQLSEFLPEERIIELVLDKQL